MVVALQKNAAAYAKSAEIRRPLYKSKDWKQYQEEVIQLVRVEIEKKFEIVNQVVVQHFGLKEGIYIQKLCALTQNPETAIDAYLAYQGTLFQPL